jgi:hypothetical protein
MAWVNTLHDATQFKGESYPESEAPMNPFQTLFDAQKSYFASGVTRSYGWRVEQLDRMASLLVENEAALQEAVAADFRG